jgi:hypothetical protein
MGRVFNTKAENTAATQTVLGCRRGAGFVFSGIQVSSSGSWVQCPGPHSTLHGTTQPLLIGGNGLHFNRIKIEVNHYLSDEADVNSELRR